ncbi:DUF4352 domain-containing protein [Halobacillus sp. H74]|uniref:DUF4352 domain-containing protein n=1 Tax=Halobacillus sp. H74 TaxID=3457436 RepID=UPI003FCC31A7
MKKLLKLALFAFLAIMVLGVAIVSFIDEGDNTADSNDAEPASVEAEGDSESSEGADAESTEEETTYSMGDTVEVGAMTYTINEKSTAKEVGPSVAPTTANGKYVVLNVTVKNNGNEAVTVDGSYFKLKQDEKTFETDSMASTSANQGEDGSIQNSFFLEQLNPGSEISGNIAFDVAPEVADSDSLSLLAQEGIFGTVSETIELQ